MGWFYLFIAIVFEVVGTTQLKRTEGNFFTSAGMLMLLFYAISFFMLTLALKNDIEVGVGYAIWSGVGTALIAVIGVMAFNEHASIMKFLCIGMIIIGVVGLKVNTGSSDDQSGTNFVSKDVEQGTAETERSVESLCPGPATEAVSDKPAATTVFDLQPLNVTS